MRPWNEKGELKEKGKRVGKQNLLIKGGNYRRKARRQKNSCIKTPKNNPYKQNDPKSMLRIENRPYDNRNPTPILIPIPISVSPPLAKEPWTITTNLYSKFENPESKPRTNEPMNQDSRVKNHEFIPYYFPILNILEPRVENQNQRAKTQEPRTMSFYH